MFTADLRRAYEADDRYAGSGSRPTLDFPDSERRERRFMPRRATPGDYSRFNDFTHGVRQVVRRNGRLEPAF